METNDIIKGIIGLVTILVIAGGAVYLREDQVGNTYYCPLTEEIGIFDRLSDSMKTGYYTDEAGLELSFPCRISRTYEPWIPIEEYAELVGVSIEDLIEPKEDNVITIINQTIINQTFVNQTVIQEITQEITQEIINQTVVNQTDVVVIEGGDTSGNYLYITNQTLIEQILFNRSEFEVPQPAPGAGKRWLCSPTGCMRIE